MNGRAVSGLRLKLNTGHTIAWLEEEEEFPPCDQALEQVVGLNGLLAASAEVGLRRLIRAYEQGIFPWYSAGQPVLWWAPDPRMVLYLPTLNGRTAYEKIGLRPRPRAGRFVSTRISRA